MSGARGHVVFGHMAPSPSPLVLASPQSWIEGEAIQQLSRTAMLPGMSRVVGMPDLHPGRGTPVGAAFVSSLLHPFLVGNDIGCGIALWSTDLPVRKPRREKWIRRLRATMEAPLDGDVLQRALEESGLDDTLWSAALGTLGGGNHFVELTRVDSVLNEGAMRAVGIDADHFALLVHSGSRGLGEEILRAHVNRFRDDPLEPLSNDGQHYLRRHDHAVRWAKLNRALVAKRFLTALGGEGACVVDACHNSVVPREDGSWLHRKGAAPADAGAVVIAGSRGTHSHLVLPNGDCERSAWSLAHGAGRKWKRSEARARLEERFPGDALTRTELGGRVICDDRALLYEEAPQAYKNIDRVILDLVEHGLVTQIATLAPEISYKTAR